MKLGFSKIFNYLFVGIGHLKTALRFLILDRHFRIFIIISAALNLLSWAGAYFLRSLIGSELAVLHYNVVFGIDLIGPASQFFILPLVGLIIFFINCLAAALLFGNRERLLSFVSLITMMIANLFCLISLYFAYLINFS